MLLELLLNLPLLLLALFQHDVEVMLWEVDEDLDGHISWDEFLTLYQRGTTDVTGKETLNPIRCSPHRPNKATLVLLHAIS